MSARPYDTDEDGSDSDSDGDGGSPGGSGGGAEVGRCRSTVSKPVLQAPTVSALETIIW